MRRPIRDLKNVSRGLLPYCTSRGWIETILQQTTGKAKDPKGVRNVTGLQTMRPVYLPKRQTMESDEDYDTGIVQNEENLNQNLNALYSAITALQGENETLKATVSSLRNQLNGK